jgi:uncharacterized membrane protein
MPQVVTRVEPPGTTADEEPGLVLGRPVEDRSFEAVEIGAAAAAGVGIGTTVGGPFGAAVGGVVGAAVGLLVGERVERAAGPAARSTDTHEREEP